MTLVGRRVVAADAGALSALALRSKAIWGYSVDFMARCREELTLTPDQLEADWGFLYEDVSQRGAGQPVGFVLLSVCDEARLRAFRAERSAGLDYELEALFVEPARLGEGIGKRLLFAALERCSAGSPHGRLWIQSDPNAEDFYVRCGAVRVGELASSSIPGRSLPLLAIDW